jgi:methylated-DNA-[protein]-cysteine S-methyltransferase
VTRTIDRMTTVALTSMESPVGPLSIAACGPRVCLVHFGAPTAALRRTLQTWYPESAIVGHDDPGGAVSVLRRYFAGDLDSLDEIDVDLHGTSFQRSVWMALRSVAAGTTASYAALAARVGAPTAVRAVGAANGANPVAIVLPCHRIIGSNGSLTGYGGGLDRKRWLLEHEGVNRTLFGSGEPVIAASRTARRPAAKPARP